MAGSVLIIEETTDRYGGASYCSVRGNVKHTLTGEVKPYQNLPNLKIHLRSALHRQHWKHSTHQQARSDREDIVCRVLGGNASTGFGNVAENTAVDDGAQDEVDMANDDER